MYRVCIIYAHGLPIPATLGGGVEVLMQFIIDENEKDHRLDLTVISPSEKKADALRKNYKNTKFVIFDSFPPQFDFVWRFFARVLRNIFRLPVGNCLSTMWAFRYVRKHNNDFDLIINEGDLGACDYLFYKRPKTAPLLYAHFHTTDTKIHFKKLNRCNGAITCSSWVMSALPKTKHQTRNSYVLKNQIDPAKFSKRLSDTECSVLKSKLGINDDKFVVLYVGRILEVKGVLELIQAVNRLDNVCLLLVGSANFGVESATQYERIVTVETKKSKTQVVQVGFVSNDELYKYQNIADVQVIPSKCQEAAGLVVLEAQAAGLPAIATRRGGIPEFLGEDAGLLIDAELGDDLTKNIEVALRFVMNNPDKAEEMSKKGLEYSKTVGSQKYFLDFCDIVEKIMRKSKI